MKFIYWSILFVLANYGLSNFANAESAPLFIQELAMNITPETTRAVASLLKSKISIESKFDPNEYQILSEDLGVLYQLQGTKVSSPLFKEIFLTDIFDGKLLTEWILKKFKALAPTRGYQCQATKDTDYLGCFNIGERKIQLSPLFFQQGRLIRLATLVHEARHSQGFPHLSSDNKSEDGVIDGGRGAEWMFLSALSSNCTNCLLIDRFAAYKRALDLSEKIKGLGYMSQLRYDEELKLQKNPLDEKYNPLIDQLKKIIRFVHAMPSLCIGKTPYNEVTETSTLLPLRDCILIYHFIEVKENSSPADELKRQYKMSDGFLLIFNPIINKSKP